MKIIQKIVYMLIASLAIMSCDRTYDAPPLNEPKYEGPKANITIASLKQQFASATQEVPALITTDLILKAYVSANDQSGNIFKQIYLQDETGAIPILADYNGIYTLYRVGQEVYVNLKGLCISVYGDEQQIGIATGNLFRLNELSFAEHVLLNGWPDKSKVQPVVIKDISTVNENVAGLTFKLVRLEGVYFVNGGTATFATKAATGTQVLKDSYGNSIDVRTSNYANFALETLPVGKGTVIAILGRFRGAWQLTIPSANDFFDFDGIVPGDGPTEPEQPGDGTVFFKEAFGTTAPIDGVKPKVSEYTGYDMKTPIIYSDASATVDVRATKTVDPHAWFTTGKEAAYFTIKGINTSAYQKVTLTYDLMANVYDDGATMNLNAMSVSCNGVALAVPDLVVTAPADKFKYHTITIENIPVAQDVTIEFHAAPSLAFGLRLDNVKLIAGGSGGSGGGGIIPN